MPIEGIWLEVQTRAGTLHIPIEVVLCSNLFGHTAHNSKMFKLGWGHRTKFRKRRINPGAGWVVGGSNVILDPTLALIRAQLGGKITIHARVHEKMK